MVKDAESHADEDKKRREIIDARNQADALVYSIEKTLRENKDKVDPKEATLIQTEIEHTKSAIETDNLDQIKKAIESLTQASHKLTEMMYQQAAQQQAQGAQQAQSEGQSQEQKADEYSEEEVIDAEVVDEEKDKTS
jgi:molecular chaperone DnaK